MHFANEDLHTSFDLPDEPTYREQLRYESAVSFRNDLPTFERLWLGVVALAKNWQSEVIPICDEKVLDGKAEAQGFEVIKWAGLMVWSYMWELRQPPKN